MIKILFYIISCIPKSLFVCFIDFYIYCKAYKLFKSYKITKVNLKIAYPDLSNNNIELTAKLSIRESIISSYESINTWTSISSANDKSIFKINNHFLLKNHVNENNSLMLVALHNRSVDMLLRWINTQTRTTSLYKKIKNKYLNSFVKKSREIKGSVCVETDITGVRKLYKAIKQNKVVCFAADQVPQRGMGEYIKFYNRDAYSTTLVQTIALKTLIPILFIYMNSNKDNFLSISINECSKDIYNDSKHSQIVNRSIEQIINKRPIDYSWEYKRFKKSRSDQNDPYLFI